MLKDDEGLDTKEDRDRIFLPRTSVALSSLSRQRLAGAEKDCLRKGDPWQEETGSAVLDRKPICLRCSWYQCCSGVLDYTPVSKSPSLSVLANPVSKSPALSVLAT